MIQIESLLGEDPHWQELLRFISGGAVPAALGLEIRLPWQEETAKFLARRILCDSGTACGTCPSCRAWSEGEHPDLITAGAPGEPATVDDCRAKSGDLCLRPVVAPVRLLLLYAPEKMNPNAANSLLKITEEPPPCGRLLYMMDRAALLPTLRSRLWMLSFSLEEKITPLEPPSGESEWLAWLEAGEKRTAQDWYAMAHGYAAWLCRNGDLTRAGMLRQLAETAMTTHLSSPMWSDMLFLLLREEYPFEHVFDDFRQAPLPGPCRRR
ncbi:MAG: DNA polymerase III subunit delta' [Pyramidobacter sp.]|nr:DNA polymerase III subunit delta' [Pyramidobacter sp.]